MDSTGAKANRFPGHTQAWSYCRAHWRGALSLALSFWINLVLLRAAICLLAGLTHPPILGHGAGAAVFSLLFIAVAHGAVFVWQVVGTVRASDRYQKRTGEIIPVYGVYFGITVCLLFTLSSAFTAIQTSFVAPVKPSMGLELARERAARYSLRTSTDGTVLCLDGSFERGMTEALTAALSRNPKVTRVVLSSKGGVIFEGRGVGHVIAERGLDSHIAGPCHSACARAFIAGQVRTMSPGAELGFHRYRLDAAYPVPFVDVDTEQDRDRQYFRAQGVSESFLSRMFDTTPPAIWIPSPPELMEAGVVHRIAAPDQ